MQIQKKTFVLTFSIFLAISAVLATNYVWHFLRCSFHPKNLHAPFILEKQGTLSLVCIEETESIFNQKFHFLGEGRECFAFESEDGNFVVKFFKARRMKKGEWFKEGFLAFLFHSRSKLLKIKEEKKREWEKELTDTANRYSIAFQDLPIETGLYLLHFEKTENLQKKITVLSKKGFSYEVELDNVPFILQEKATLTMERISYLLKNGMREEAIQSILELHELILKRTKKGITDPRQCYGVNFGFGKKGALQIDVGKIVKDERLKTSSQEEIYRLSSNLKKWVKGNCPEIYPDIEKKMCDYSILN